ncbi:MAG TPA: tetratricopeptide repeat protein [Pirellulales bacterium]|nr:tetratricopeptide repeat protein [Pirellulales bacterium]
MSNSAVRLLGILTLGCAFSSACFSTVWANEADDLFDVAAGHYSSKHWDLAAEEFRQFLSDYPDHAKHNKAVFLEAESLVQLGRSAEAYPLFVDLLADDPTGPDSRQALYGAAEAAVLCGKTDEAQIRLAQFQSQYPADKLNAKVLIYRGDLALKAGDLSQAEQLYRQALEKFSDLPTADQCRLQLAHILEIQQLDQAAETMLHQVAQSDHSPWAEMALLRLAGRELAAHRPQAALEQFEAISKRFPESPLLPQTHLGCGQALIQLGHYAEAESLLSSLADNQQVGAEAKHLMTIAKQADEQAKLAAESRRLEAEAAAQKAEQQAKIAAETRRLEAEAAQAKAEKANAMAHSDSAAKESAPVVSESQGPTQSPIRSVLSSRREQNTVVAAPVPPVLPPGGKPGAEEPQEQGSASSGVASANESATDPSAAARAKTPAAGVFISDNPTTTDHASSADSATESDNAIASNSAAAADSATAATISTPKAPTLQPVPPEVVAAREDQARRRSAAIMYQAADGMIRAGQYDRAIATLQMGDNVGDDPRSLANRYLLAMALHDAKREDESLVTLDDLSEKVQARLAADNQASAKPLSAEDLANLHTLNDNVQLARATALLTRGKYAEAIAPLKMYLSTPRKDVGGERARSALAISLVHVGQLADAQQILDELKANHPTSQLILPTTEQVADAAYAAGQYQVATVLFNDLAADGNPPDLVAKGLSGMAWSKLQLNEDEAAEKSFAKFLEHFPGDPRAADAALACGQILEREGNDNAALAVYREAIKHYGKSKQMPKFLHAAARLYDRAKQEEDAAPLYQRIVHDYPTYAEIDSVLYSWAWSLRDLGRGNESDKVFRLLYENHPDSCYWADAAYRLAERASQQGEDDTAEELLKQIVTGNSPAPVMQHALFLEGQISIAKEKWEPAEAALNRLIQDYPDSSMRLAAEFWLAETAYRSGDYVTAQQRFETLAPRSTNRNEKWAGLVPLRRAQIAAQQNHWVEALTLAESIAHDFPQFSQQFEADYLIGRCLAEQSDYDGARAAFDKVVHSPAGSKTELAAIAQWMMGETYYRQNNYSAALREYLRTEVVYSYPRWQAAALLQAAKCYEKLGQPQQASETYTRVLQNYPQTEFVAEASKRLVETTRK